MEFIRIFFISSDFSWINELDSEQHDEGISNRLRKDNSIEREKHTKEIGEQRSQGQRLYSKYKPLPRNPVLCSSPVQRWCSGIIAIFPPRIHFIACH